MTPELNRNQWDGVIYENKRLGVEWGRYPLNYHFYPDTEVFPVEVSYDNWKNVKGGVQIGETTPVTTIRGVEVGGDVCLIVETGTHVITGLHTTHVRRVSVIDLWPELVDAVHEGRLEDEEVFKPQKSS